MAHYFRRAAKKLNAVHKNDKWSPGRIEAILRQCEKQENKDVRLYQAGQLIIELIRLVP